MIYPCDLSRRSECGRLLKDFRPQKPEILINCAGFGVYGTFTKTDRERELTMLEVNCQALHILMKAFLRDMERRGHGYILNVASLAGLAPGGPRMAAYYATKAYVVSLTRGVAEELRADGSRVYIGALCPGPVKTSFFERSGLGPARHGLTPEETAQAAMRGMERGRTVIVPGAVNRLGYLAAKFLPGCLVLAVNRRIQERK